MGAVFTWFHDGITMKRIAPFLLYIGAFITSVLLCTMPSCSQAAKDTLKADAVGCGKSIALATYVQIPTVFAGDDWQAASKSLGAEIGKEALNCAARDVLAILTARKGPGPSTSQPEPLVLHLQTYVNGP